MQLLKIRFYQFKRNLGILFFPILALASIISFFAFDHPKQYGYYAIGIIAYLFYNFHKSRQDLSFVYKHFNSPEYQIILEYQLFLLPVSIPVLFTGYWIWFFVLHTMVLAIPMIKQDFRIPFRFLFLPRYLKNDYVFIAGVRKNFFILSALAVVALLLSPLKLFPLVALFLLNMILFSFYEINESVQMIQASNKTPARFLSEKSSTAASKLTLLNTPVLIINTLFNNDLFLFNVYFLVYNVLMLVTIISLKYSDYQYKKTGNNNQVKLIIMVLGLFIPYLFPLIIIFYIQSRAEARKNLSTYLDDNS